MMQPGMGNRVAERGSVVEVGAGATDGCVTTAEWNQATVAEIGIWRGAEGQSHLLNTGVE
jgi:hypothetical protein